MLLDPEDIEVEEEEVPSPKLVWKQELKMGTYFRIQLSYQWLRKILAQSKRGKSHVSH